MENFIQSIEVLTQEELVTINQYIDTRQFAGSTVLGSKENSRVDNSIRTSTGTTLDDNCDVARLITDKLNAALWTYKDKIKDIAIDSYPVPGGISSTSWREGIQILDYVEGQKYEQHFDTSTDPESKFYHRQVSIVLYLSDGFEGGCTKFPHKAYKPPAGHALFFPSNWCFPHKSEPVISGKKRVAVTWYYVKDERLKHNQIINIESV